MHALRRYPPIMMRQLWRLGLRGRFLLFQRRRHDRLVLEQVAGRSILVLPQVFNPQLFRTGAYFAQVLDATPLPAGATVLDMGTGSGIGAICVAPRVSRVVAVDINPAAVRCAQINVLLHEMEDRVEVRQGDLFDPVAGEQFDVILFNPPFFRGQPQNEWERALWAEQMAERFAAGLPLHLAPTGYALVLLSSDGDVAGFLRAFRQHRMQVERIAERNWINETMTVYCVRRVES